MISSSIISVFEEVAALRPAHPALVWPGGSWSYGEVNARANRMAHFLVAAGVKSEQPIGVLAARSPETLLALLAILKAGAAYVPLDPLHPKDRLAFYVETCGMEVVLVDPKEKSKLSAKLARLIELDPNLGHDQPENNLNGNVAAHSLAHILFTSGSTGQPKGVMIEHRGVVRLFQDTEFFRREQDEVWLQHSPLGFDASTFELWGAWLTGATLALPPAGPTSLNTLAVTIKTFRVSTLMLSPALFNLVVDQEIESLEGIRQLFVGGDVLSPVHAGRFLRRFPNCALINAYGPTECTVAISMGRVSREEPMPPRISIGRPIRETGVFVMDEQLRPVAPGQIGEILVTGEGLARGYHQQPALTERNFVQIADSSGQPVRAYRTGDLGSFRTNGNLDFHGRRDDQVKINGLRIEPGEIQNVLQLHPAVRMAEVIVLDDDGKKRLEVFALLRDGAKVSGGVLRRHLGEKLPVNWLPPTVHLVDHFPLNRNGKIDRAALAATLVRSRPVEEEDDTSRPQPADFVEKVILNIWEEMFPRQSVGLTENFFDLGGDSLKAMSMLAQIQKVLGRELGFGPLLEGGTVTALAAAARAQGPVTPPPIMICTQGGTARPPLFFAHGDYRHGGMYCRTLAQEIGPEQPLYAFTPYGTFGGELPATIGDSASRYLELMRSVQPTGPYHLGGFCNGALVMYEVAQQLTAMDETVASLILVDPPDEYIFMVRRKLASLGAIFGYPGVPGRDRYYRMAEFVRVYRDEGLAAFLRTTARRMSQWVVKKARPDRTPAHVPATAAEAPNLDFYQLLLLVQYVPRPLSEGVATCALLQRNEFQYVARQVYYWKKLVPHIRFAFVVESHDELRKSLANIGKEIRKALGLDSVQSDLEAMAGHEDAAASAELPGVDSEPNRQGAREVPAQKPNAGNPVVRPR